jgi:hypothetical protein
LSQLREQLGQLENDCSKAITKLASDIRLETKDLKHGGKDNIHSMMMTLEDMKSTFPHPPTFFLSMIIGNINLALTNKNAKLQYKQEYEKYKMLNTGLMMVLSIISLIFFEFPLPSALVHCISVWYYFTITLRELVLLSNGSKIKLWWLIHHYGSIIVAAVSLMWPPGTCYASFKTQFMFFSFCLSCVMTVQFFYQRAKLYRQVAMGKSHHLVVTQESSISTVLDFSFLVICLVAVYIFQFYNAYTLYNLLMSSDEDCKRWQVGMLSIMFALLGALNSWTLMSVLWNKLKKYLSSKKQT